MNLIVQQQNFIFFDITLVVKSPYTTKSNAKIYKII